ncbi:unnamed protein product [Schistosoma curassoni]|uniref:Uncharacterized protein n=1 Tax=Schistosoma curassoni TaxID=6186 RepID=A0A183JFH2_9TREM|nr:unnamed protein product [Schistosoma curassoni]
MSNVMEATSSPDEAGLDSTLKYEKSRYNNANVFLPNTPIIIKIVHSCESQIIIDAGNQLQSRTGSLAGKQLPHGSLVLTNQSHVGKVHSEHYRCTRIPRNRSSREFFVTVFVWNEIVLVLITEILDPF